MTVDRAEIAGTGAAIAFHAALIAALSLSLAHVPRPPEPPSMEVELVDEVGLKAAAPSPLASPLPPSQAPEQAQDATPPTAPPPEPMPVPQVMPTPAPRAAPSPAPRPVPQRPILAKPVPAAPAHISRIGADFLKGIADSQAPAAAAAKSSAPSISPSAMAGIQQAIRRQVQPCADRQINPGPGASKIKVKLHLILNRAGRLTRPPEVVSTSGVDDDNSKYEERVKDLAVASFTGCAPLAGLPQELYQTSNGGWSNFNMTYSLP
ncbi:MAG: cell envelope biogenesis protein TolA [Sphingomicrobium sp.]|nr:cell envelope biogenesis protein TolA [Sphingomonadales bacterium]